MKPFVINVLGQLASGAANAAGNWIANRILNHVHKLTLRLAMVERRLAEVEQHVHTHEE